MNASGWNTCLEYLHVYHYMAKWYTSFSLMWLCVRVWLLVLSLLKDDKDFRRKKSIQVKHTTTRMTITTKKKISPLRLLFSRGTPHTYKEKWILSWRTGRVIRRTTNDQLKKEETITSASSNQISHNGPTFVILLALYMRRHSSLWIWNSSVCFFFRTSFLLFQAIQSRMNHLNQKDLFFFLFFAAGGWNWKKNHIFEWCDYVWHKNKESHSSKEKRKENQ